MLQSGELRFLHGEIILALDSSCAAKQGPKRGHQTMHERSRSTSLESWLRHALQHLYDPAELAGNPLAGLLVGTGPGAALALRRLLIEAIEALKPDPAVSPESDAWRTYQALSYRFVKQFSQSSVALTLNLSVRQMRRQEGLALQELVSYIGELFADQLRHSEDRQVEPTSAPEPSGELPAADARQPEAPRLQSLPDDPAPLRDVLASLQETTLPLERGHDIVLLFPPAEAIPDLTVNRTAVRQCLLNTLAALIPTIPGGQVEITVSGCDESIAIEVVAVPGAAIVQSISPVDSALLDNVGRLAALAGGSLEIVGELTGYPEAVRLRLPSSGQVLVLAVDDNADAIQLLQRFLSCSRYKLVGEQDPQAVLLLATRTAPAAILLDVMMPGIDGWELLGRLRSHPLTMHIPVIVCSVLPQEQLALALGASAFLIKPLMPEVVLTTLDRLVG
jgi:CheY-like chemotaxis protein